MRVSPMLCFSFIGIPLSWWSRLHDVKAHMPALVNPS
jgi:hypothetical protein